MNVLLSVIDPVAISIGPIKIYWYGIIIALAMLIGISLAVLLQSF
ncbi:prolipoprotein diacylglyceryl transferase family protein, partial [Enterococcus faecalis]